MSHSTKGAAPPTMPPARGTPRAGSRVRNEAGAASVAQVVLVAPVLLLTLMLIVQFALLFHARNVAENAAQQGASVARRYDGSDDAARRRATAYLDQLAGTTLISTQVGATRTSEVASVTVSGTVVSLVPGLRLTVSEAATGPVERYVPPPLTAAAANTP